MRRAAFTVQIHPRWDTVKTPISTKGKLVPAKIRRQDDVRTDQTFEFERVDTGELGLLRLAPPPDTGVVDWLLACPDKGYFVAIESGWTNTLCRSSSMNC